MKKIIAAVFAAILLCTAFPAFAGSSFVLKLPSSLAVISEEAFVNCSSIARVEVAEGTASIGSRAFAFSDLDEISLPASIAFIADDAFEGCYDLWIEAENGSYAYRWAQEHGFYVYDPSEPEVGDDELGWA